MTPAVCKSSAGAVEHLPVAVVTNLARYLGEIKGPSLWVYAAAAEADASMWGTQFTPGAVFVLGAEGRGLRPLVRRACDEAVSIPLAGQGRLAERQRRCGTAPVRGAAAARVSDPTLYLFDGYNVLRAAGLEDPAELVDRLASFVAVRGARGVVVFDGVGTSRTLGPLEIRFAPDADAVLERLAAEHRAQGARSARLVRHRGPRDLGAGGGEGDVESLRRPAARRRAHGHGALAPRRPARPGNPRPAGASSQEPQVVSSRGTFAKNL